MSNLWRAGDKAHAWGFRGILLREQFYKTHAICCIQMQKGFALQKLDLGIEVHPCQSWLSGIQMGRMMSFIIGGEIHLHA